MTAHAVPSGGQTFGPLTAKLAIGRHPPTTDAGKFQLVTQHRFAIRAQNGKLHSGRRPYRPPGNHGQYSWMNHRAIFFTVSGLLLALGPMAQAEVSTQTTATDIETATEAGIETIAQPSKDAPRDPQVGPVTGRPLPRFVSLKSKEANARRGPGLANRIDWKFTRPGMPLLVTAEYEHWLKVEDADGLGGWVNYTFLTGTRSVLVTEDMAEFRAKPEPQADLVFQAEIGVIGRIESCGVEWCEVTVEHETGWVVKTAVWGVTPNEAFEQ